MYNVDDMGTLEAGELNEFITNYRNSLQAQKGSAIKQLDQTRRNNFASIMGAANRRGMLYSNFTGREKQKYDTGTYMPALVKAQTSYQTGIDALRNNAVSLWNKIQSYKEAIQDLQDGVTTTTTS